MNKKKTKQGGEICRYEYKNHTSITPQSHT